MRLYSPCPSPDSKQAPSEYRSEYFYFFFAFIVLLCIFVHLVLTCQRLIFRSYGEPVTENVTLPRAEVRSQSQDTGNDPPWQRQYGGINNNMAAT